MNTLPWIGRLGLGALFTFSGFEKLIQPAANFAFVVQSYQVVPAGLEKPIAQIFPWVEFLAGVFLLAGLYTPIATATLWLLNTSFIGIVGQALIRKLPIENCGCFGEGIHLPLWAVFALDIALWAAFLGLWKARKQTGRRGLDALYAR